MRGRGALVAIAAALAISACEQPYKRTNPYDPQTIVSLSIVGPDTIFSAGEFANFHLVSTPAFSDSSGSWDSSNYQDLRSSGGGLYQVWGAPLFPLVDSVLVTVALGAYDTVMTIDDPVKGPITKAVTLYRRNAAKTVIVTQRLVEIQLRCPTTHACAPVSAGSAWTVWVDGYDALGAQIYGMPSNSPANPSTGAPVATFVSRDTTVASVAPVGVRVANVMALRTGSTWIVATRGALTDSLQMIVE